MIRLYRNFIRMNLGVNINKISRRVDFTQGISSDDVPINDFISQVYQAGF